LHKGNEFSFFFSRETLELGLRPQTQRKTTMPLLPWDSEDGVPPDPRERMRLKVLKKKRAVQGLPATPISAHTEAHALVQSAAENPKVTPALVCKQLQQIAANRAAREHASGEDAAGRMDRGGNPAGAKVRNDHTFLAFVRVWEGGALAHARVRSLHAEDMVRLHSFSE